MDASPIAAYLQNQRMNTIPAIVSQHAEEAAFLWILRDVAIGSPHYSLKNLARLDARIDAHLEGLEVAGEDGWNICVDELGWAEPGEVFAASALAFLSDDVSRMQPVLEAARKSPELARGMIAALGFLPRKRVMDRIAQLTNSRHSDVRFIGLSASAIQRIDPGKALIDSLESDEPTLRARARRAAGELGRRDLLPSLRGGLREEDLTARFWAAWSLGLLGDRDVVVTLREFAASESPVQLRALDLSLRLMDLPKANSWRQSLAGDRATQRLSIIAAGIVGDPVAIPCLIENMTDVQLARVAGESFTTITGADPALLHLDDSAPDETETGPNDNPEDENIAMDADDNLPWPDSEKIKQWWSANSGSFASGRRYLLGRPITPDSLQKTLCEGRQLHRAAAAIEIMLADPKAASPLFEVRAHARAQKRLLGL